ncbi:MAG: response regulator [Candidatus Azobacteroides sp.]|nr:response regulator [Candidatus Azobacteroides sp.]
MVINKSIYIGKVIKGMICFFLLFTGMNYVAGNEMEYRQLTNSIGLSNSALTSILQDSASIMWFGTWDGLNAFNGKDFTVYKPEPGNKKAISNNIIRILLEEKKGILWIATDHGVNRMDTEKEEFTPFYFGYEKSYPAIPGIYTIAKTSDNTVFCSALEWGLSWYDEKAGDFRLLNSPFVNTLDIRDIKIDRKDHIWLLHRDGRMEILHLEKDKSGHFFISWTHTLDFPYIRNVYSYDRYMVLVDDNKNIYVYNADARKIFEYNVSSLIPNADILHVTLIEESLYVTSTAGGYYKISMKLNIPPVFDARVGNMRIPVLYQGDQDILWAGTDGYGVYMIYDANKSFKTISLKREAGMIRAFCEDNQKRLWIGTKGGGITVLNNYTNQPNLIAEYTTRNGLLNDAVYAIVKGFGGDLFIGSDGKGLNIYTNQQMTTLDTSGMPFDFFGVYSIYCSEKDSMLWVGTSEYGFIGMKIRKNKKGYEVIDYKRFLHNRNHPGSLTNNVIYAVVPEDEHSLWIGTRGGGLNKFSISGKEFEAYQHDPENPGSLSNNDVLSLYKDNTGTLWVGTSVGLNVLKKDEKGNVFFKKYSQTNGLPNNTVHGISEDWEGNIWISTNRGLAKIEKETDRVTSYYETDGLQNNEFSDGAYYKSQSGNYLFFGGISGFNVFNPDHILQRKYIPAFQLSSFRIFNKEENIYTKIKENKKGKEQLILTYKENFFSFHFQAVDYIQNQNCEYKYRLEGFDKDWILAGNTGIAIYTNIAPGKYTLQVAYTNGDKVWVEKPYTLDIVITPPFWKTWIAYFVYFLFILGIAYVIYFLIRKRLDENRKILIERLERKETENIHEAKLRFFTNIAHEFYTPITLIYGPCEKILEKSTGDEYITRYVKVILSNAKRMKHLISELMEFRKIDTGHMKLHPQVIEIPELLEEMEHHFSEITEQNRIDYSVRAVESPFSWITDMDALEKILFNILSNAFKYTPEGGYIRLEYGKKENNLVIKIMNSGKGIDPEHIHEIFNRFRILEHFENQIEKGDVGRNGIGLALTQSLVTLLNGEIKVESVVNESTTFIITLPPMELPENQLITQETEKEPVKTTPTSIPVQLPSGENGSPLILIVDDEPEIRALLRDTLNPQFPNIMEASHGLEALQLMKTKRPNLIICDVMMPEMDGLTFVKELKNNVFTNHLPIIFLSAKDSVEDQILAAQSGSDVYITKPFHPKHVLATVESILIKHKLIQDYYNSSVGSYDMLENGRMIHAEDKEFLIKIIRFLEENLEDEDMSADLICEELGISKMSLYRKIKATLDQTPGEFIKSVKLNRSVHYLLTTTMTVQEIIYRCGFNNKSYFYREFAKRYHLTPKEYREKHQG